MSEPAIGEAKTGQRCMKCIDRRTVQRISMEASQADRSDRPIRREA